MINFGILKASGLKSFIQCFDKNFTPNQEKKENKIIVTAKTVIPSSEFGHINIKGLFSLFKPSERYISPILSLEHENYFQINYNLLKNSASMLSLPGEAVVASMSGGTAMSSKQRRTGKISRSCS